jgi:ectoine hydroxylase-related dioxygenase (phytanoyl-CoA dioxygenase family)
MTTITSCPTLRSQGFELDLAPERFGWMESSIDLVDDVPALRERMARDGYLFLPGLLHREEVLAAKQVVAERLAAAGALDPEYPVIDCVAGKSQPTNFFADMTANNPALVKVLYDGPMIEFFEQFLGEPVRHYDFTWFRAIPPGKGTASHCDVVYMGRGETARLFTAWTPIGDVSLDRGGLLVLEGSNNNQRLKSTYGQSDVDAYCENKEDKRDGWAKGRGGWLGKNAVQIQKSLGNGRWLTRPDYRAGDVVIFSVYTVHASLDNQSNRIRLSSDTRYQPASSPADERWIGPNPAAHGKAGKRGKIC